jgi:hypothetical protein
MRYSLSEIFHPFITEEKLLVIYLPSEAVQKIYPVILNTKYLVPKWVLKANNSPVLKE